MKRHYVLLLLLTGFIFSCTKDNKTELDPLVGTWRSDKLEVKIFMTRGGETVAQEDVAQNSRNYIEFVFNKNGETIMRIIEDGQEIENDKGSYTKHTNSITISQHGSGGSSVDFKYTLNGSNLRLSTSEFYFEGIHMDDVLTILEHAAGVDKGDLSFEIVLSMRKI